MPWVQIKLFQGRNDQQKKELVKALTDAVCKSLGVEAKAVQIVIEDVPKASWGMGGQMASDLFPG